jgi:hypothetical protein
MAEPEVVLAHPLRLEVTYRLTDALKEISKANGYFTDLNGNVFRGRAVYGDETPLPALSILEVPIPAEQAPSPSASGLAKGPWELMIQGWVEDDRVNPTDPAQYLLADVKKRLALEAKKADWDEPEDGIFGLGSSVDRLYIGSGVVRPPEEISVKAFFWLTVTLDIVENLAEPTWA